MTELNRGPHPVSFPSADGKTVLIGYLWVPKAEGPSPAVVMLHGRAGAYSSAADGYFTAKTLSRRHRMWGRFWADRGYVALMVDSFGPRGYPAGFPAGSYPKRPARVSEKTVRPLDAYGALGWLRVSHLVRPDAIGLQGWSNGAMAALWAMSWEMPERFRLKRKEAFRAALVLYPGCGGIAEERPDYQPYNPLLMLLAGKDEEVDPVQCEKFAQNVGAASEPNQFFHHTYRLAQHSYDHPDKTDPANAAARADTLLRAAEFFDFYVNNAD